MAKTKGGGKACKQAYTNNVLAVVIIIVVMVGIIMVKTVMLVG